MRKWGCLVNYFLHEFVVFFESSFSISNFSPTTVKLTYLRTKCIGRYWKFFFYPFLAIPQILILLVVTIHLTETKFAF